MAKTKVTPVTNNAKSTLPDLVFWNPIVDLSAASNSLDDIADKLDNDERYGEGNMLRLIGRQLAAIAEYIDNNWKPEGA